MAYDHLREIAVLPCLPDGMSVEDRYLTRTASSFGARQVRPDDAFADVLAFLNSSKSAYLTAVWAMHRVNLLSGETDVGVWRSAPAAARRALRVAHDRRRPSLITVEQLDNASYGGQLAIAGYVDTNLELPCGCAAVQLVGRYQIGIIDNIWGSGHTVTFDGSLTVDLTQGQMGDVPGRSFDGVCDFVVDYFGFRSVAAARLPAGTRFVAEPAPPTLARAA